MASTGWPFHYRFCSLDMFSFSLNPEIVSFLWKQPSQPIQLQSNVRYHQPTQLFHIILPVEQVSLLSTVQRAVVTTGILVVVGLSSCCAYSLLQCVRQNHYKSLLQRLRHLLVKPFVVSWRKPEDKNGTVDSVEHVGNNNYNSQLPPCKRPSDLQIVSSGSPIGNRLRQSSRETSLERRLLTKVQTPLADCDVACGEEDVSDIQGQYFGPTMKSSTFCMDLLGSSPEDTPTHDTAAGRRRRRVDTDEFC